MPEPNTVEISIKGRWLTVPALYVAGKALIVRGRWLRMAMVESEEWLDTEVADPQACIDGLKQARGALKADIFVFSQKPDNAAVKYEYAHEFDSVAVVPVKDYKQWWESLPQESRKNVRRAEKRGVTITVKELDGPLIGGLVELNNDSPTRQGKRYTHFGKTPEQVWKDQESFPDRRDLIWAHHGEELVGFMKIIYRGNVASVLQLLPKASHNDKRPANALMAKAVELCSARGMESLAFGMFNYGNKKDTSLREFKVRNGFDEILVPRYYVPLTWRGALAMRLKLHRGAVGILPHNVITFVVAVRTKLYSVKQWLGRCSSIVERSNRNRQMERANPPAGSNT